MNLLFTAIGRRSYIIDYFKKHLAPGDQIFGTSNHQWSAALRYCDRKFLVPPVVSGEYIPALLSLCRAHQVKGLLSFLDVDVDKLSRHRDEFVRNGITPVIPSAAVSKIGFDKYETFKFLAKNNLPAPFTCIDLSEAERALDSGALTFPVILKPRFGFASRDIFIAKNRQEMTVFFHYADNMMVQELIAGEELDLDICTGLDGKVLSAVPWKKIAVRAGETDISVTIKNDRLLDFAVRFGELMAAEGHVGPMDVDVFQRDGEFLVLEFNPRFGGGYPVSQIAGADFPGLIVQMIKGENPQPRVGDYRIGAVMMKEYNITENEIPGIEKGADGY